MLALGEAKNKATIRVWDPVVRLFHWTLVAAFSYNYIVQSPRTNHRLIGYVVLGAITIRLIWGFVGTKHARFCDFVPGPRKFFRHVQEVRGGTDVRHIGHNPAGGAMVVVLMVMLAIIGLSGWSMGLDMFHHVRWMRMVHELSVNLTLMLVILHIGGVVWESWRHRENLVVAMITGNKKI